MQQRQVLCRQVYANRTLNVHTSRCGHLERPETASTCQLKICSEWQIRSEWTSVSGNSVYFLKDFTVNEIAFTWMFRCWISVLLFCTAIVSVCSHIQGIKLMAKDKKARVFLWVPTSALLMQLNTLCLPSVQCHVGWVSGQERYTVSAMWATLFLMRSATWICDQPI